MSCPSVRTGANPLARLPGVIRDGGKIGKYWGPCLPAFRSYSWLFGSRVSEAIARAEDLEAKLSEVNVPIIYPLEGYARRFLDGRLTLSIASPPRRLIEALTFDSLNLAPLLGRVQHKKVAVVPASHRGRHRG